MNDQLYFPDALDSSILADFKSCAQLAKKRHIDSWRPKEGSVHLHAGGSFAKGLEVARTAFYVEGLSADDSIAKGMGALLAAYGSFECPADSAKSVERTAGAFEFYFDNYPLSHDAGFPILLPGGKRGIEFNFVHPLPIDHPITGHPLLYCGRMDAILNYSGGVFLCDEKTTTSLGATWSRKWDLRSQFTGYCWGARESGIKVDGVIVRGVSILKTKYETAEAISYRPEWQVDRWYIQLLSWITAMVHCWKTEEWKHNLDNACEDFGGCSFKQVCASQDETPWLETYFEQRQWDPITRTETLLFSDRALAEVK